MADDNNGSTRSPPPSPAARRASFSPGQSLSNMFSRSPTSAQSGTAPLPGTIANAAANAQNRRRMSITTLGLSGSPPGPTSPFGAGVSRQGSISSAGTNSASVDENVIEETDTPQSTPNTPFARRMSFGARALRDARQGSNGSGSQNSNGRSSSATVSNHPTQNSASSPTLKGRARGNEGFNWSESLRNRAERTSSIGTGTGPMMMSGNTVQSTNAHHQRAKSVAIPPAQEMPKEAKAPDHFQERILKGDFYMD